MKKLGLAILGFIVLVSVAFFIALPRYVRTKIESGVESGCPACRFQMGVPKINPLSWNFSVPDVSFTGDPKNYTHVKFEAAEVSIDFVPSSLLRDLKEIKRVKLTKLRVHIEEKYEAHPAPPDLNAFREIESSYGGKWMEDLPSAVVGGIELEDSSLEYILDVFDRQARIGVSEINATISEIATRKYLGPRFVAADLTGRVQKSGLLHFKCRADLFSVKNEDAIEIDIRNLTMGELDSFFLFEDGLQLRGEASEISTSLSLNQGFLKGELWARYHDLSMHVFSTPKTGELEAMLVNLVQGLKTAKTKPAEGKPPPVAAVSYRRKPGQSLIKFILQGLKEAAMKVISN